MTQEVAVVIPCRNEARTIAPLLDALAAQTRPPRQVVVVDDASADDTVAVVQAWAQEHPALPVAIARAQGRGAGAAMNAGIAAAGADVIVRLDGHCRPDPTYIQRCLETLALPGTGVAGGVWDIQPGSDALAARGIAAILSHPLGSGGAEYRRPPAAGDQHIMEVDTVPFGTFHKSVWAEIDGFDESLVRNQDYDFNYRVRLTGRRVILDPAIVSAYRARATLGALARQYFGYGYWKIVMLRKFPKSLRIRQLLPLLLLPLLFGLAAWALAGRALPAVVLLGAYAALILAGGLHAAIRARDLRLFPFSAAALFVLQNAWSAGAWASLVRGTRAGHR